MVDLGVLNLILMLEFGDQKIVLVIDLLCDAEDLVLEVPKLRPLLLICLLLGPLGVKQVVDGIL